MYKLTFFVPASHLESVKQAVFSAGAGRQGNYDHCCWQTLGQGQFRPLEGSTPFIGTQQAVTPVEEYRVEMLCEETVVADVIAALKLAHPYEEPAYDIIKTVDI
jgi:hypothetical protein